MTMALMSYPGQIQDRHGRFMDGAESYPDKGSFVMWVDSVDQHQEKSKSKAVSIY